MEHDAEEGRTRARRRPAGALGIALSALHGALGADGKVRRTAACMCPHASMFACMSHRSALPATLTDSAARCAPPAQQRKRRHGSDSEDMSGPEEGERRVQHQAQPPPAKRAAAAAPAAAPSKLRAVPAAAQPPPAATKSKEELRKEELRKVSRAWLLLPAHVLMPIACPAALFNRWPHCCLPSPCSCLPQKRFAPLASGTKPAAASAAQPPLAAPKVRSAAGYTLQPRRFAGMPAQHRPLTCLVRPCRAVNRRQARPHCLPAWGRCRARSQAALTRSSSPCSQASGPSSGGQARSSGTSQAGCQARRRGASQAGCQACCRGAAGQAAAGCGSSRGGQQASAQACRAEAAVSRGS